MLWVSTNRATGGRSERQATRHLGAGAALSVAADVGTLVASAGLSVVLARAIGSSANGTYALLLTLINIAVLIASLGLGAGITYQLSNGTWPVRRAFRTAVGAAVVLGAVGTAAALGFYDLTKHTAMRPVAFHLALIALPAIPAALLWQFTAAILLGRDRYERYASLLLLNSVLILLGSAGLALSFGLTGAVIGFTASTLLTAIAGALLLRRWIRSGAETASQARQRDAGAHNLTKALRFGLQAWVANMLQQVNYRFDLLILGAYAAASHIGVYSVAATITAIAWILPHGLQTVLFPRAASLHSAAQAGDLTAEESDAAVTRATRHSVLLMLPAGLVVALLLTVVPLIYGRQFDETVPLGFVLLPGVLALGVGKVLGSVVIGRARPRFMLYTGALGAAVSIGLYFILIPPYHEWGASAASSLSYAFTTVVVLVFFRRATGIPFRKALVPTRADARNYIEALSALRLHLRSRRAGRQAV